MTDDATPPPPPARAPRTPAHSALCRRPRPCALGARSGRSSHPARSLASAIARARRTASAPAALCSGTFGVSSALRASGTLGVFGACCATGTPGILATPATPCRCRTAPRTGPRSARTASPRRTASRLGGSCPCFGQRGSGAASGLGCAPPGPSRPAPAALRRGRSGRLGSVDPRPRHPAAFGCKAPAGRRGGGGGRGGL